jgi:hypothetical protein
VTVNFAILGKLLKRPSQAAPSYHSKQASVHLDSGGVMNNRFLPSVQLVLAPLCHDPRTQLDVFSVSPVDRYIAVPTDFAMIGLKLSDGLLVAPGIPFKPKLHSWSAVGGHSDPSFPSWCNLYVAFGLRTINWSVLL